MLNETYHTTYKIYKENGGFKYTTNYEEKKITFHEYLTLSSIVESEMKNVTDKSRYISLLLNRIENNPQIALNSDATVRYANKKRQLKHYQIKIIKMIQNITHMHIKDYL
ncbi:endolytic transglycosylase MltG [Mammaliicoccus sciuri]|nr:endolytic transglycosylase MltG [Mammaliicoccus sciuri]